MKFVLSQALCPEGMAGLKARAEVFVANDGDPNNYLDEMRDADAVILRIAKIDRRVIQVSPKLKVIGRTGVGYDNVDVRAATESGIPVVITPGANNRSVAEHAVAMMFSISKNLVEGHTETVKGNFMTVRGMGKAFEILGKTAGFIGLGAIGRETASLCRALGMRTVAYDPYLDRGQVEAGGCEYRDDYEKMLEECDFVSLHVPLLPETRGLIGRKQLELMKRTGVLINCARGGIVDEEALAEALDTGVIAGAGLDVFEEEPPRNGHPLFGVKNLLISPHSAAQTKEAVINMALMCVEGCFAVLDGEKWPHVADKTVYGHDFRR
jgi:D-3-phosphoglycerate dehydrogenase